MATNSKISKTAPKRILPWQLKSISRSRQDIQSWNSALNMAQTAEEPKTFALQLLYNEILTDAHLYAQIENRKQQLFSADFSLKLNGETQDEATAKLKNTQAYHTITNAIYDSQDFGNSLVELNLINDAIQATVLPRTNVVPQKGLFYRDYSEDTKPIAYRELKEFGTWIIEFDSGTVGVLNKAVPHVLFKRFAQSCWSELCEIYGIPPRVLKTNTQDIGMLNRGEQMMKDMGAAAYFIIDETEELQFATGVATNGDVYKNLITFCNNEISLLKTGAIIGQDTEHGSRGKEQVSQDMLWLLVQADMRLIEQQWNTTVIPALENIGYLPKGLTFEFEQAEDLNKLFEYTEKLLPHYDIDPQWIKQKFGVEVTAKKTNSNEIPPDGKEKNKGLGFQLNSFFD